MANLYELSARFQQLLAQDEYTADDMKEMDQLHTSIEDECIDRGKYIKNLEAQLMGVQAARKDMQEREAILKGAIERNEIRLATRMSECGIKNITKSPLFLLHLRENPPAVDDFAPESIPEAFWTVKEVRNIDKVKIKDAIQEGVEVPGCRLIRRLSVKFK